MKWILVIIAMALGIGILLIISEIYKDYIRYKKFKKNEKYRKFH